MRFVFFLNPENLICRTTDISKCFRGSLQLRDNESRLYKKDRTFEVALKSPTRLQQNLQSFAVLNVISMRTNLIVTKHWRKVNGHVPAAKCS